MKQSIASALAAIMLAVPGAASADTDAQVVSLYQQIIALLTQELAALQGVAQVPAAAEQIKIDSPEGIAPYIALIELPVLDGTEALDFGDGHSTGSNGCVQNAGGYCDLRHALVHTYQLPGTYQLVLYRHDAQGEPFEATTAEIVVR